MRFIFVFAAAIVLSHAVFAGGEDKKYSRGDFRNYFGLAWASSPEEILQYCQNVGHTHVMYKYGMEKDPRSNGITFYIETPEYSVYRRVVDLRKKYSPKEIESWESICAVAFPDKPFPRNMATGWFFDRYNVSLQLDMQQKKVHEIVTDRILDLVGKIVEKNPRFKFGGYSWDVPQPYGDFNQFVDKPGHFNRQTTLKHWTGYDGTPERPGIKHDYGTYFEGYFEFYRLLMEKTRAKYPGAKFIVEPYNIYNNWIRYFESDFMKSKGAGAKKYMADFIWSESGGLSFVNDANIFKSGQYSKCDIGNSSPSIFKEADMRAVAGAAAAVGSWTAFFGRYGGYDNAPYARSIRDIPARIKLGKLVPVWENLNNTPLSKRNFVGGIYKSPTAYMSEDAYWAIQPEKDRMVFVFITERGAVEVPDGWEIEKIYHLDGLFGECGAVPKGILKVDGNSIRPGGPYLSNWAFSAKLKKSENAKK